ncbi:MAG: hypothetical protein KGV51_02620 [Moraxellaceae bacterium]|nr:hypothetical protein [Moraxellaceae bacterium]
MVYQLKIIAMSICCCLLLTACGEKDKEQAQTAKELKKKFNLDRYTETETKKDEIKEQLTSHYANLASKNKAICPKLLQQRVDMSVIRRSQEQMKGEYCDYYLYPKKGQVLNITSKDSALAIYLRMPYTHDFANGKYLVKSNRRHVIRVSYAGSQLKPSDLTYNINIEFE